MSDYSDRNRARIQAGRSSGNHSGGGYSGPNINNRGTFGNNGRNGGDDGSLREFFEDFGEDILEKPATAEKRLQGYGRLLGTARALFKGDISDQRANRHAVADRRTEYQLQQQEDRLAAQELGMSNSEYKQYRRYQMQAEEGLPPQGYDSQQDNRRGRYIPRDEFRHTEVAPPPPPPSPDRANSSSMTAPKDDVVNPVAPASPEAVAAAKPPVATTAVSSATTPAAEAASPAPQGLSRDEAIALQTELSKLGLGKILATSRTPSGIDGIVGDKTRTAFEQAKQLLGAPDLTLEQLANPEVAIKFKALVAQHLDASKTKEVAQTPAAANPPVVEAGVPMQEAVRQALAGGLQPTITGGADTGGPQGTPMTPNAQPDTGRSVS